MTDQPTTEFRTFTLTVGSKADPTHQSSQQDRWNLEDVHALAEYVRGLPRVHGGRAVTLVIPRPDYPEPKRICRPVGDADAEALLERVRSTL